MMRFGNYELAPGKHPANEQGIARFANGYGASVIRGLGTYGGTAGLWELGVIEHSGGTWDLCYDTPITDDVVGNLTESGVADLLAKIEALPARGAQ